MNRLNMMATALLALAVVFCGCSQTFADQIRSHRGCIGEAQIAPERVDACLRNTDGQRPHVNICLVDKMVPDSNIRMLNDCIDTPIATPEGAD